MWTKSQEARLAEIGDELETLLTKEKSLSDAGYRRMEALNREGEQLLIEKKNYQSALKYAGMADPIPHGGPTYGYGDRRDDGVAFKGFGTGVENRIRPTSVYEMDRDQIAALKQAALQGMKGFRVEIGSKGVEHGIFGGQVRTKAAVTEGGLSPNLLPPVQQPRPAGFWGLPYELTRVANFLPNIAVEAPGVAWFRHDSNGAEAAYTAEGASKPDLTPVITEQYTRFSKVAGRILLTHELVQDAGDAFSQHLVSELARSLYNAESNLLLNGTTGGNGWNGINHVSGTLTRAADIGTTDVDALDTLSKAFVDLRSDFFVPIRSSSIRAPSVR